MAGIARKQRERDNKRRAKKARRDANQLHFQQLRDQGRNKKSKRFILNSRQSAIHGKHKHEISNCGNHGCKKCTPRKDRAHVTIQKVKVKLGLKPKQKLPTAALARLALSAAGGGAVG